MSQKLNQSTLLTCLLLSASTVFVSSCQDYEPYNDVQDKAYTHEFERQFGKIDPEQDWDLFGQLARRKGPVTRAGAEYPTITLMSDTVRISKSQHDNYTLVLPEIGTPNNTYANSNMGQVTQDFLTTARHIDFIPVHWTTSAHDSIGIYWYVEEDEDPDVTAVMGKDGHLYYIKQATILTETKSRLDVEYVYNDNTVQRIVLPYDLVNVNDYLLSDEQMAARNIKDQYLVSHPYKIVVPNSISEYGFWIHNKDGSNIRYSEWNLNPACEPFEQNGTYKMSYVATFNLNGLNINGITVSDNNQYMCFEDWINGGDADLNDVIYIARGLDDTNIKDNEAITENAILVCEDLASYDFDFNDVVLGLTYKEEDEKQYVWKEKQGNIAAHWEAVSTQATSEKIIITPMAAGGAYETTVTINGVSRGEIHALLKESPALNTGSRNHSIINAYNEYQALGDPITIDIPTNHEWHVGNGENQYATHLSELFHTGFFKLVCYGDNEAVKIISNSSTTEGQTNQGQYTEGKAPQMMLLPHYFEWPKEEVYISDAYNKDESHGFENWVQDISQTNWIFDSQVSTLVTDRGEFLPDEPEEEEENQNLMEAIEVPFRTDTTFVYGDPENGGWIFYNAVYIDLQGIDPLLLEDAKATVIVHYTLKPANIYFDDAAHNLLVYDTFGDGSAHTTYYTFSARRFNMAVDSEGMWLVQDDDNPLTVSKVEIQLIGVTDPEHRHNLVVNPTSITFNGVGGTQILTYSSSTNANVSFTTTDINVAQVRFTGNDISVYAQGIGTCEIIVTAEATTQYKANVIRIPVVVNPTLTLNLGTATNQGDITVDGTTYTNIHRINATTSEAVNLSDWSNGAKLTIHYSGLASTDEPIIFRITNNGGTVITGDYTGYKHYEHDITFNLTADQLNQCVRNDGLRFRIWYNNNSPTISNVRLTKIVNP